MSVRKEAFLIVVMLIFTAGCQLPAPSSPPTATLAILLPSPEPPTSVIQPTASTGPSIPTTQPAVVSPSAEVPATATETPVEPPTQTPLSTSTPSGPRLDPTATWGTPAFTDPMDSDSLQHWAGPDGNLPNTENIRLELSGGELLVTGKKQLFDTWWFSWPYLRDFYLEMTVKTGACSGLDSYGLILRGPARGAGSAHGYIAALSCDGRYQLRRLDNTDPYSAVDLIGWAQSTAIHAGADQTNVLGIQARGNTLTLYANGYKLAEFTDNRYLEGRYGIFVRSGSTQAYTYRVDQIAYWVIGE